MQNRPESCRRAVLHYFIWSLVNKFYEQCREATYFRRTNRLSWALRDFTSERREWILMSVGELPTFAGRTDYHGPCEISLLSSEWDQVEHSRYNSLTLTTILRSRRFEWGRRQRLVFDGHSDAPGRVLWRPGPRSRRWSTRGIASLH